MKQLRVIYDGFNPKLDDKIIALFKKEGFKFWASGFDFVDKKRDICFEKK